MAKKPLLKLSGSGTGAANPLADFQLASGTTLADLSDAIGVPTVDYRTGAVAEITIPAIDDGTLRKANAFAAGSTMTYNGAWWDVVAVEREYKGTTTNLTFTLRSALARKLRNITGPQTWTDITPAQWIRLIAKRAGGKAVAQEGSKARKIVMKRGQSTLDVIASLASDTSVEWVEFGGTVYFGTPYWAFMNGPKLPMWKLAIDGDDPTVLTCTSRSSLDDRQTAAEISLSVPQQLAQKIRPWHTVNLSGLVKEDTGLWLVRDVNYELRPSAATITATRPLKSSPKNGSGSGGSDGEGIGAPVAGSTYRDADRPNGWKSRTANQILAWYKAHPRGDGHKINNGCLYYAQEAADYAHENGRTFYPEGLWDALASHRKHPTKSIPPGAVVLYKNGHGGHAVIYMGGGKCLSTDMAPSGAYAPNQYSIGPIDKMAKSFGVTLLGWYSP